MREYNFSDQLLSVSPLNDMITHEDVVAAIPQCD